MHKIQYFLFKVTKYSSHEKMVNVSNFIGDNNIQFNQGWVFADDQEK